jgi:2-hydroxy-3-keto-5-methylthiopentenyl-1-phosphate phosphatase
MNKADDIYIFISLNLLVEGDINLLSIENTLDVSSLTEIKKNICDKIWIKDEYHEIDKLCYNNGLRLFLIGDFYKEIAYSLFNKCSKTPELLGNELTVNDERLVPKFIFAGENCCCRRKFCIRNAALSYISLSSAVIFIGSTESDGCLAEHSDFIFAKGALAHYCNEKKLPHYPFTDLSEVLIGLRKISSKKRIKFRNQAYLLRKKAYEIE